MKVATVQKQWDVFGNQPRSLQSVALKCKIASLLSTCVAAASLLVSAPAFAQSASMPANSDVQKNLTCVTEGQRLVCDVQQPGQPNQSMTFEQKADTGKASETVELTPVKRTAIFSPELDGMLSSGLLWTFYLSLPISVIVAIWRYDQRDREQMVKLVEQVATLERIWQKPQVH
jgi:hypothetical protein